MRYRSQSEIDAWQAKQPLALKLDMHNRLMAVRVHARKSQREMAAILGVQQCSYSMYENGVREMSLSAFRRLVTALNIDVEWLLFGELPKSEIRASNNNPRSEKLRLNVNS